MTRFGRRKKSPSNKLQSIPSQRWRRNFQLLLGRCLRAANVHLPVAESQLFRATVDLMYLNDYWWHRLPGDVSCTTWWVQRGHKSHLFSVFSAILRLGKSWTWENVSFPLFHMIPVPGQQTHSRRRHRRCRPNNNTGALLHRQDGNIIGVCSLAINGLWTLPHSCAGLGNEFQSSRR